MRLVRVNPHRDNALYCVSCQEWHNASEVLADIDGTPFQSYYCESCVRKDQSKLDSLACDSRHKLIAYVLTRR